MEATINDTEYTDPPQSRIEQLLLELKEAIEGGGSDVTLSSLVEAVTGYPLNDYASMSLYSKDLNTITKSGFYNAMTCTNAPFNYMTLTVVGYYLEGYTVQIACDVTTGEVKKRNNINGTWSDWESSSGGSNYTYSTNEQEVGTWIDGKTVYEKTYEVTNITSDNNIVLDANMTPSAISLLPGCGAVLKTTGTYNTDFALSMTSDNTAAGFRIMTNANGLCVNVMGYSNYASQYGTCTLYVTIRYTKSSN